MKIALLGLCQVVGMGDSLRTLLPMAAVHAYHVTKHDQAVEDFIGRIKDFDLVITQILPSHRLPDLELDKLKARGVGNLHLIPPLAFGGFHPDACIIMEDGAQVESPIDSFHSKILAAAFLLGASLNRTLKLFNTFTYAQLGYLDTYDIARSEFNHYISQYGFGHLVERSWPDWLKPGAFMYTPLHPCVRVLSSFATEAAKRSGLVKADAALPEGVVDALEAQHAWPVYPGMAERIGVAGSMVFRTYASAVVDGASRDLSLEEFAARSFAIFESHRDALAADPSVVKTSQTLKQLIR